MGTNASERPSSGQAGGGVAAPPVCAAQPTQTVPRIPRAFPWLVLPSTLAGLAAAEMDATGDALAVACSVARVALDVAALVALCRWFPSDASPSGSRLLRSAVFCALVRWAAVLAFLVPWIAVVLPTTEVGVSLLEALPAGALASLSLLPAWPSLVGTFTGHGFVTSGVRAACAFTAVVALLRALSVCNVVMLSAVRRERSQPQRGQTSQAVARNTRSSEQPADDASTVAETPCRQFVLGRDGPTLVMALLTVTSLHSSAVSAITGWRPRLVIVARSIASAAVDGALLAVAAAAARALLSHPLAAAPEGWLLRRVLLTASLGVLGDLGLSVLNCFYRALFAGMAGLLLPPMHDAPVWRADDVRDFWGARWNRGVAQSLRYAVYVPLAASEKSRSGGLSRKVRRFGAALATFAVSGALHAIPFLCADGAFAAGVLAPNLRAAIVDTFVAFALQPVVMVVEAVVLPKLFGSAPAQWRSPWLRRLWVWTALSVSMERFAVAQMELWKFH